MDKLESIIALGIIILILVVFFAINISSDDVQLRNNIDREVDRNISLNDVTGTFTVKDDKNSKLLLNDDGTYSLNINICDGYLELQGVYFTVFQIFSRQAVQREIFQNINRTEIEILSLSLYTVYGGC